MALIIPLFADLVYSLGIFMFSVMVCPDTLEMLHSMLGRSVPVNKTASPLENWEAESIFIELPDGSAIKAP